MLDRNKLIKRWIILGISTAVLLGALIGLITLFLKYDSSGLGAGLVGFVMFCFFTIVLIVIAKPLFDHYREKRAHITTEEKAKKERRNKIWIKIGIVILLLIALFCVIFAVIHLITLEGGTFGSRIVYALICILMSLIFFFTEGQGGGPGELWEEVFTGWGLIVIIICILILSGVIRIKTTEKNADNKTENKKDDDDASQNEDIEK